MIKDYPNLSLKLVAAAILMIASISAVVFLYKDSQKRSLLYSHAYSSNTFTPNETSVNPYPTIGKASNQRINSDNNYPSFKGANTSSDYTPIETVVPTITTTSIGIGAQNNTNYNKQQNATNTNPGITSIISGNSSLALSSHSTTGNSANSSLTSTSIFAENNLSANGGAELQGNGRMLVDGDPPEPGVPIGNGNYILILLISIYGFIKLISNNTIKKSNK